MSALLSRAAHEDPLALQIGRLRALPEKTNGVVRARRRQHTLAAPVHAEDAAGVVPRERANIIPLLLFSHLLALPNDDVLVVGTGGEQLASLLPGWFEADAPDS